MWANAPAPVHAPTYPEEAGTHQSLLVLISRISPAPAALRYLEKHSGQSSFLGSAQIRAPGLISALQSTGEANKALQLLDLLKKLLR